MASLSPPPLPVDHHLRHRLLLSAIPSSSTLPHLKQAHAHLLLSKLLSFPTTPLFNRFITYFSRSRDANHEAAVLAYAKMRRDGVPIDRFSLPALLRSTGRIEGGDVVGREVHGLVVKMGFGSDPFVQTGLVGFYGARGRVGDARLVFDRMSNRDLVAWGVMLDCYYQSSHYKEVLSLYQEMRKGPSPEPDQVILVTALSACARTRDLKSGEQIHASISRRNLATDGHLDTALINMYASCASMDTARRLYDRMPPPKNPIASTAMVSGYSKSGSISAARLIFDQTVDRDLILWSAMISAYAESDCPDEVLNLFSQMRASGVQPDRVTVLSVVSACARIGALERARWIDDFARARGFRGDVALDNAVVDMYAKCGSVEDAVRVFEGMGQRRNVISWTSVITGLAMHGEGVRALGVFDRMVTEGVTPNEVTFVGVLYACGHAGMVEEGRRVFKSMVEEHGIKPRQEHYGCVVDLLGRAKRLDEAHCLVESMPFRPSVVVWGSLLAACRVHGDVELGELAATRLLELDPDHDGAHVLLSNIYAKRRRWEDVKRIREAMKRRRISKERGRSWVELGGEVHEFGAGDESHPRLGEIRAKLGEIVGELRRVGYEPDAKSALIDLEEEEERREAVLGHGEKLAVALGLIEVGRRRRGGGGGGRCVRIVKNLRVCEDCHVFMKLVSWVYGVEVVLRDRSRFHHFRDGVCSCNDFW